MPHFILDCSENILKKQDPRAVLQAVLDTAFATGLFNSINDIKVRLNPFKHSLVLNSKADFIHVFANIMEGRTTEQKAQLSREIVSKLNALFPDAPVVSINIRDFEKATYCNKSML